MQTKVLTAVLATLSFMAEAAVLPRATITPGQIVLPEVVFNPSDLLDPAYAALMIIRTDIEKTATLVGDLTRTSGTTIKDVRRIRLNVSPNIENTKCWPTENRSNNRCHPPSDKQHQQHPHEGRHHRRGPSGRVPFRHSRAEWHIVNRRPARRSQRRGYSGRPGRKYKLEENSTRTIH